MEMYWMVVKELDNLPKHKPFLITLRSGVVNYARWAEDSNGYYIIDEFGASQITEKDILNNDNAFWLLMPQTPEPLEKSHYLNYK